MSRWWACDSGHSNPLPGTTRLQFSLCPQCPPGLGIFYRIEADIPEDDPTRLVAAPMQSLGQGRLL